MGVRVDRIQAQIDALQRELAKAALVPEDDFENLAVIFFEKRFGGSSRTYHYVALKIGSMWFLTGKSHGPGSYPKTWDTLCEFIGDFDKANVYYATEWERV